MSKGQAGARRVREGGGAHKMWSNWRKLDELEGGLDEMQKMRRETAWVLSKMCLAFWDLAGAIIMS